MKLRNDNLFIHVALPNLNYQDLIVEEVEGKGRHYCTPNGNKYPSVTTVLSSVAKEGISDWRNRVGEKEANRVTHHAVTRGLKVHDMIDRYLDNRDDYLDESNPLTRHNFNQIKPVLDNSIGKIYLKEDALYSDHLQLAGRVDCIAEFNGKLSIIDFKTSAKPKRWDWIHNYFMQETAYAIMFEERTGIPVNNLVTIIVNDVTKEPQLFVEKRDNWVNMLQDTIDVYYGRAV